MNRICLSICTVMLAFCATLPFEAKAQSAKSKNTQANFAVTEFSANMMREHPDYAAELGNQALMGTVVELLDTSGIWVKIKSPEPYTAWVNDMGLVPMTHEQIQDYVEAPKYICTAAYSHIFEEPTTSSQIISELVMGDIVRILYKKFTHTSGPYYGYEEGRAVLSKKFVGVVLPSGKIGYVESKDVDVFYKWAKSKEQKMQKTSEMASDLIETAKLFVGVPYMWGGTSIKNVDCSGLTRSTFFANGILLPRNASQQAKVGVDVPIFDEAGNVDWSKLLPGDLLFWGKAADAQNKERISHVGMYIGDGMFIHSSEIVRINSLDSKSQDYYSRRPVRARRVLGFVDKANSGIVSLFRSPVYFIQN